MKTEEIKEIPVMHVKAIAGLKGSKEAFDKLETKLTNLQVL